MEEGGVRKLIGAIQNPINPEAVEAPQTRADDIRKAQDAWAKLNACLHYLGPLPPGVLEGWDRIKPWLNCRAQDLTGTMEVGSQTSI